MTKPVIKSELYDAILQALGRANAKKLEQENDDLSKIGLETLYILLVEDGLINQRVALSYLSKAGHQVVVANNGKEAVEKWATDEFDLILMDVQMPVMDGYSATREIRRREEQTGKRVKIIAMTAAAMKGDYEKCLEAGMDDCISKPIDIAKLLDVISVQENRGIGNGNQIQDDRGFLEKPLRLIDWEASRKRVPFGDDSLRELAVIFLRETPKLLDELKQGLATRDDRIVRRAAHTMHSSCQVIVVSARPS